MHRQQGDNTLAARQIQFLLPYRGNIGKLQCATHAHWRGPFFPTKPIDQKHKTLLIGQINHVAKLRDSILQMR
jgi:hypothetical protein